MKFLDERIKFVVTVGGTTLTDRPAKGMYTYQLMCEDSVSIEGEYSVFVGNLYYNQSRTVEVDVTDILRNLWYLPESNRKLLMGEGAVSNEWEDWENMVGCFYIKINFGGSTGTLESNHELVFFIWRYHNGSAYNTTLKSYMYTFFDATLSGNSNKYKLMLLGESLGLLYMDPFKIYNLIPHYPLKSTGKLCVGLEFEVGRSVLSIPFTVTDADGEGIESDFTMEVDNPSLIYDMSFYPPLSALLEGIIYEMDFYQYIPQNDPYMYINERSISGRNAVVAIFDKCPARYYLQWKDRFGSYQCQAFKDDATYSEDIINNTYTTYDDKVRKYNVQVQPKWKLNSGWISEQNYIYYESILVSPYLYLYDAKQNLGYEVTVKGNWTEKNYKNQKNLLKMELDLEATEKQNINY